MALEFNFDDCLRVLEGINKRMANQKIDIVLQEGAKIILEGMRIFVPVGDTGKLKKSLDIGKISTRKGQRTIQIGIVKDTDREVTYGYYQHYGTRRMVGKYWINQAWINNKSKAKEVMKSKLKEVIKG